MNGKRKESVKNFMIFCAPTILIFSTVVLIPFIFGIYLTFTNWNGISGGYTFAGVSNYLSIINDHEFWDSILMTLEYVIFTVLFTNVIAFLLAYLLTTRVHGQNTLRASFFTPNIVGGIILGIIWNFIFSTVLTYVGNSAGIEILQNSWLGKPETAFWALVLVSVWQYSGYMMVIYIAGLMNVPKDMLEAASVDGANEVKKLFKIVIPLVVPSFIICVFLTLQRAFMVYDLNMSLTKGGPFGSTKMVSMFVYEKAFLSQQFGVGQSAAIFLFVIVAIVTVTQLYFSKKLEVEA